MQRNAQVVPLVSSALQYEERRGAHSVGSHVRDAAAYVCWAFARAYKPGAMAGVLPVLTPPLLMAACYDREVNCRRAAAAAFQESVGRLGAEHFPNGIEILTSADYFVLGSRRQVSLRTWRFTDLNLYSAFIVCQPVLSQASSFELKHRIDRTNKSCASSITVNTPAMQADTTARPCIACVCVICCALSQLHPQPPTACRHT